jgi:hypothetical protein
LSEVGSLLSKNPGAVGGAGAVAGAIGSVTISELAANSDEQYERERKALAALDREKGEKPETELEKLAKKRASAQDIEIRRQAHDQWRHEPLGPTKHGLLVRAERAAKKEAELEAAAAEEQQMLNALAERKRKKAKEVYVEPPETRQRGAPKQKPRVPDTPPNPFGTSALAEARAMRGTIIPAPTLVEEEERAKTGRTERSRGKTGRTERSDAEEHADMSAEVDDLIADLETSDITKDLLEADRGDVYKSDVYKRRSQKVVDEKPNIDWLAAELEVFDKELHSEPMGTIRNTQKRTGTSKRQRERDEKTRRAMAQLPDDLLPY